MLKKVSIVIPTFNQAEYLPVCVEHCLFQTYENIEIIIVDGGSTDNTKHYLNDLEKEIESKTISPVVKMSESGEVIRKNRMVFPRGRALKILSFDSNIGATRTYNEGFKQVTGEYCTYVVGDDIPHPHMIEELALHIEQTGMDFVYSDMDVVDDKGRIIRQMRLPDFDFKTCFAEWFHLGVSKLYRTRLHEVAGLMDEINYKSANDYDHYLRFAMHGASFVHLPRVLYSVRHHGDDRKTGQHTNRNYQNLMNESKKCAWRARKWLQKVRT